MCSPFSLDHVLSKNKSVIVLGLVFRGIALPRETHGHIKVTPLFDERFAAAGRSTFHAPFEKAGLGTSVRRGGSSTLDGF